MVITGESKGQKGRVLEVDRDKYRAIVEGVNMVSKHTKPNAKNKQGGILEREGFMAISNVMAFCDSVKKPSRIKMKTFDDGRKVRVYQKAPTEVLDKS